MAKKENTAGPHVPGPNQFNLLGATDPRRVNTERERRRYVKRAGGLVKDLSEADTAKALKLCDEYGLSHEAGWDLAVSIPNLDAHTNPIGKRVKHR